MSPNSLNFNAACTKTIHFHFSFAPDEWPDELLDEPDDDPPMEKSKIKTIAAKKRTNRMLQNKSYLFRRRRFKQNEILLLRFK